jgi:hypothetical protein
MKVLVVGGPGRGGASPLRPPEAERHPLRVRGRAGGGPGRARRGRRRPGHPGHELQPGGHLGRGGYEPVPPAARAAARAARARPHGLDVAGNRGPDDEGRSQRLPGQALGRPAASGRGARAAEGRARPGAAPPREPGPAWSPARSWPGATTCATSSTRARPCTASWPWPSRWPRRTCPSYARFARLPRPRPEAVSWLSSWTACTPWCPSAWRASRPPSGPGSTLRRCNRS